MTTHIHVLSKSEMCGSVSVDSQLGTLTVLSQSWNISFVCEKTNVFQTVTRLERHLQRRHLNSDTGENMLQIMIATCLSLQCKFGTTSTSVRSHRVVHKSVITLNF